MPPFRPAEYRTVQPQGDRRPLGVIPAGVASIRRQWRAQAMLFGTRGGRQRPRRGADGTPWITIPVRPWGSQPLPQRRAVARRGRPCRRGRPRDRALPPGAERRVTGAAGAPGAPLGRRGRRRFARHAFCQKSFGACQGIPPGSAGRPPQLGPVQVGDDPTPPYQPPVQRRGLDFGPYELPTVSHDHHLAGATGVPSHFAHSDRRYVRRGSSSESGTGDCNRLTAGARGCDEPSGGASTTGVLRWRALPGRRRWARACAPRAPRRRA